MWQLLLPVSSSPLRETTNGGGVGVASVHSSVQYMWHLHSMSSTPIKDIPSLCSVVGCVAHTRATRTTRALRALKERSQCYQRFISRTNEMFQMISIGQNTDCIKNSMHHLTCGTFAHEQLPEQLGLSRTGEQCFSLSPSLHGLLWPR